ncbi:Na/Pi cotransporter family protein [Acidimangrovimonas sediminis]|uniref:Na/Pi cotransporter family protein n=1 Tax=Acidimangrovimonas sediminis TaxID=2056283 RepID=UPI000C80EC82|nr:Na/Pi cotransporter family protein [Acidimangrovimonas sediminis]
MESLLILMQIAGAVALLLFGLREVREGISQAFGVRLKVALGLGTRTRGRAFFAGLVATLGLQSSTATALMTADFVEREMIRQRMAQVVLLGANVGTALTAWIVSLGIEQISPLLILAGFILRRRRGATAGGIGLALIGVGLTLLSLTLLSQASAPLRESEALRAFLALLDAARPVAFLASAILAVACSSSLATVMLVVSLGASGAIPPGLAIVLVLGANFGGAIPPVIATAGAGIAARRVTLGNLLVRGAGCLVAMPLAEPAAHLLAGLAPGTADLPVEAHLGFNLLLAAIAWPLSGRIARGMQALIPERRNGENVPETHWLDDSLLETPALALAGASRETLAIGDMVEQMMRLSLRAFKHSDPAPLAEISRLEEKVDVTQQAVKFYLSRLGRDTTEAERRRSILILDYVINLEHAGDIIEKNLLPQVSKKISADLRFSEEGYHELNALYLLTLDSIRIAQTIFMSGDTDLARQLMETKVDLRRMERNSATRHFDRLRDGFAESLETSSLHLDMLRDLKRINAHIFSVAYPILDEEGMLIESRLKKGA